MQKEDDFELISNADIDAGIYVVNELHEIFIIIKGLLETLKTKIHLFPVYSIVGLSTRNFTLQFVNAWHDPLERILRTMGAVDCEEMKFRSDSLNDVTLHSSHQNDKDFCVEDRISHVTVLLSRLCDAIEVISSAYLNSSDDADARNKLGHFGIWLCTQMRPFPKIVYPKILEEYPDSLRGLNDLRPKGC